MASSGGSFDLLAKIVGKNALNVEAHLLVALIIYVVMVVPAAASVITAAAGVMKSAALRRGGRRRPKFQMALVSCPQLFFLAIIKVLCTQPTALAGRLCCMPLSARLRACLQYTINFCVIC